MMTTNNGTNLGIYIHIPFCRQKCLYCDFLSMASGTEEDLLHQAYMDLLKKEIQLTARELPSDSFRVDSVFLGGGTPSLVDPALITDLMSEVRASFHLSDDPEITIESNPGTLTSEKLMAYREAGINRLSMGVQSFDPACLKAIGRIHGPEEVVENFRQAREAGFDNINLDLMFSLPGQTMESWRDTLKKALELSPEHLSYYSLQIEEGTPFYRMIQEGTLKQNSDQLDRQMYEEARALLRESGYHLYEISNTALPGRECRHNLKYWSMEEYLGLGLGSHSYLSGQRFSNARTHQEYGELLGQGKLPRVWTHQNTREDEIGEYLFTGLRKEEGISLSDFHRRFGEDLQQHYKDKWHKINEFIENKQLIIDGDKLKLTESGIHISNRIFVELI